MHHQNAGVENAGPSTKQVWKANQHTKPV